MYKSTEVAQLLLQHGANVDAKNHVNLSNCFAEGLHNRSKNGAPPLHICAEVNATETAQLLLAHGADIQANDEVQSYLIRSQVLICLLEWI